MEPQDKTKKPTLICLCNAISQEQVEDAIRNGCNTLGKIFDCTTAGVGACGGSCQPILRKMLDSYNSTGKFPANPRPSNKRRR